jgi:hypothetical protein
MPKKDWKIVILPYGSRVFIALCWENTIFNLPHKGSLTVESHAAIETINLIQKVNYLIHGFFLFHFSCIMS